MLEGVNSDPEHPRIFVIHRNEYCHRLFKCLGADCVFVHFAPSLVSDSTTKDAMNYTYTGEQTLVFTGISHEGHTLKAVPGETYELDDDPNDPRFVPSGKKAPAPVSSTPAVEPPENAGDESPSSSPA